MSQINVKSENSVIFKTLCSKSVEKPATQLELDHRRLIKQEQTLRKDMGKKRIKQLKLANEDEDKAIHKLEKLLRIDKSKSKKAIPKMFHDGLDYALEMCLPENIEKMYAAAKEAADADQQSDSEWQEDFAMATGELESKSTEESKNPVKSQIKSKQSTNLMVEQKKKAAEKRKANRLREIESKYFNDSDDELASDLSDVDSEFERSENDDEQMQSDVEDNSNDGADFEDADSDDEAPEEISTVTKSSRKRQLEKAAKKSAKVQDSGSEEEIMDDESESEEDSDDFDMNEESDDEPKPISRKNSNKTDQSDNADEDTEQNGDSEFDDDDELVDDDEHDDKKPDIWEDIYGRKRDKAGNIIKEQPEVATADGKYVPPHMRARLAAEAANGDGESDLDPKRREKLMRLKRLLKGQLNRLSEANMHKIATEIDNFYMQNSRNDMNTTLSALICDALISHSLAPERMVMEHALLIAALHANVGTEVGANLLENLIDRFCKMLDNGIDQYDVEDKTLDNVIFVLCHMYTFKVSNIIPLTCIHF